MTLRQIIFGIVAAILLSAGLSAPVFAARQKGKTLADLPPAAQMAVSAALGRDNAVYHAVKIADGYSFVLPETFQSSSMPKDSSDVTPAGHPLNLRGGRVGLQERSKTVASFSKDGAVVSGWRLSLAGIGRGDTLKTPSSGAPVAKGNRIEYRRGAVTEWYVNGPLGLEQGFTLDRAPEAGGTGPITLAIKLPSYLKAEVVKSRTDVVLTSSKGAESLKYGNLVAWDATGRRLEAWFELSTERVKPFEQLEPHNQGSLTLNIRVNDGGARYPITIDPLIEEQELTASDAATDDLFGTSVSLSSDGNTALIGAYGKNSNTGAAYVFVRSGTGWSLKQELTASDAASGDEFGSSVSLSSDGNTALIGAPTKTLGTGLSAKVDAGAAYVFVRSGTTWGQKQELTASDAAQTDYFGFSVSLSGDGSTALIGAALKTLGTGLSAKVDAGAAYVFVRSGTTWGQKQELTASDAATDDEFGSSASLSSDGSTALIGAKGRDISRGAAYVFVRSGTSWSQQQELTASGAASGDYFGNSVSLSGDGNTALIGAVYKNSFTGAAYVFVRSGTSWSQQQELTASDAATDDYFGFSVSLSGDGSTALIGAAGKNSNAGAAYVFVRSGTSWKQQQELTGFCCAFGSSVSLSSDGGTALIGAYRKKSSTGASDAGAAYVFPNVFFCSDGYYINGAVCSQCGAGTYQVAGFNTACIQAPAGSYVSGAGASSATACAAGTYQNQTGQTSCLSCPSGSYQDESGQSSCVQAPAGSYVSGAGASSPTPCAAGTYQNQTGQTSCLNCSANTYQPATGQTSCFTIPKAATSIIIDPSTSPSTVYAGIDTAGVYKSTDNTNWAAANGTGPNTLTNLRVKALARSASGAIYAGTYGGGVFKTTDGGANWTACGTANMTNLNVVSLAIDPIGKLYAGTEAGVFVSSDGCATWTAINNGLPN